jgi:LmbE family N-acetylglucosaminyl deacetylase
MAADLVPPNVVPPDLVPSFADDAFRRVLCVVAHPDDVEYGISSAVASWTARGLDVAYLLLTRGEAGIDSSPPERTAQLRTEEQIAGSRAVGVTEVEFLDYPDGILEYGLGLRRDIARVIRRYQPDAVVVGPWDVEFPAGLNQADHRVAGLAALDALRDAGNRWVFPELLDEGGCSWAETRGRHTAWTSPESRWNAASPRWRRMSSTWPRSRAIPRPG